jgi:hypothetical protein
LEAVEMAGCVMESSLSLAVLDVDVSSGIQQRLGVCEIDPIDCEVESSLFLAEFLDVDVYSWRLQ